MASDTHTQSTAEKRQVLRSPYVTLGAAVRYSVRRAPSPRAPCGCCGVCGVCAERRRTLERLQRFRFGRVERSSSADRPQRAEKLKELTERLRSTARNSASAPILPPVPPPRTRHAHAKSVDHRFSPPREPSLCCASPLSKPKPILNNTSRSESVEQNDLFDGDDIKLVNVEPRRIVGSYTQKTIAIRSASFTQGDLSAPGNYYRGTAKVQSPFDLSKAFKSPSKLTQTNKIESESKNSFPVEDTNTDGGSNASVDSAVGSDEGLIAHASPAPHSPPPELRQPRSLTHPLPKRPESKSNGGSLQCLTPSRTLHLLHEESDASFADSARVQSEGVSPVESGPQFSFPPPPLEPVTECPNLDCECSSVKINVKPSGGGKSEPSIACAIPVTVFDCVVRLHSSKASDEDSKEDETITSEKVDCILAALQNPNAQSLPKERKKVLDKAKRRKGIYITNPQEDPSLADIPVTVLDMGKNISAAGELEVRVPERVRDSLDSPDMRTSSNFGDKSDDSISLGPPSPGDIMSTPIWPTIRRPKLVQQSSDEREEELVDRRRPPLIRADSASDSASESGTSNRDRTASPSPFTNSDLSDVECKTRLVRAVRGPYGKMLEASNGKEDKGRRSMSDATVRGGRSGIGQTHVRATSSPSKLEVMRGKDGDALLAELLRGSSEALSNANSFDNVILSLQQHNDTRTHVVVELYDTERSYVESLEILVKKYLLSLKSPENAGLLEPFLVDEIFQHVPSILAIHEIFLEELRRRLEAWDVSQKIGDVLLDVFSKPSVIDTYLSFINNWKRARDTVKTASANRPAFAKFLEAMARDHKGKLSLDNLLIKPVQKFPRYEMLIQRLIKHTDPSHPDHRLLKEAQRQIHDILVKINCTEREGLEQEQQQATLRELESLIEGLGKIESPERSFVRCEHVRMNSGQGTVKERAVFLFSDLFVVTSHKRRTGNIKKPNASYQGSIPGVMEGNKYKLLMKLPLADVDIVKTKDENLRRRMLEVETLREDINTLTQISDLMGALHTSHGPLEDIVREMLQVVNRQLMDRRNAHDQLCVLELSVNTQSGAETLTLIFPKTEKRSRWEEIFVEAKQKLEVIDDKSHTPVFLSPVPIRKTRAGLQFTCAAPTLPTAPGVTSDVWVCNSDGYVGQVCVLTLQPKPQVSSCNGVCNARILCVACVPASYQHIPSQTSCSSNSTATFLGSVKPGISVSDHDSRQNIRLDSSSSSDSDDDSCGESQETDKSTSMSNVKSNVANSKLTLTPNHSKSLSNPHTTTTKQNIGVHPVVKSNSNPAVDKQVMGYGNMSSPNRQSSEDVPSNAWNQPSMWLGTEDGCIHVFNCNDSIRLKKNKLKLQHGCAVYAIVYVEKKVFVSLGNGDIIVYGRDIDGTWIEKSNVSTGSMPVTKMLLHRGRLWCVRGPNIDILNTQTAKIEETFQVVGADKNKPISHIAIWNSSVWIALHNTALLKCFHAGSRELTSDHNVTEPVTKMLQGCDDIIRQHKAACLRVTSLLACKETLWVGTSAGVLLTADLHISHPQLVGIPYGHTGHVRFLTVVENTELVSQLKPSTQIKQKAVNRRSAEIKKPTDTSNHKDFLVISGGDGYEDFRNSSTTEDAGREDSTNHLLLWKV